MRVTLVPATRSAAICLTVKLAQRADIARIEKSEEQTMKSAKRSLFRLSVLAVAFFGLIGAGILVFGQQPEPAKTGVPDDWSHHHLIFTNPGTATQAIAEGRFLEWSRIVDNPRYRLQQIKRGGGTPSAQGATDTLQAEAASGRATPIPVVPSRDKKNTLARDWSQSLGGSTANVAAGMSGGIFLSPSTPSCTNDYMVLGVAAAPTGTQPNLVGLSNLYINSGGGGICSGTPSVFFSYEVGTGAVITSPTLGLVSGEVLYVESASTGAKLHVLKNAGSGTKGTISAPVVPGSSGSTATDTAVLLNGSPTVTYSSVFYDYGDDIAYVGDDSGRLHKFAPVFGGSGPAETLSTGSSVWPAQVSSIGGKLTSPVLDTTSAKVYVSDGAYLCSVSPALGSASGGVTCTTNALGSDIVDAPIVDSSNKVVYVFVGSVPEVAAFSIATGNITSAPGSTASIGISSAVAVHDGDFNNVYYNSANGTGTLYACGNSSGDPTLYSITVSAGALSAPTAAVVMANSTTAACSPLVEYYNTTTSTDWLFGGVSANSCGANGATTAGGCVMSFNITSGAPTIGPWMPSYAFPASAEIVDTNGNLQKCTGGCGDTGGNSGSTAPASWSTTSGVTTNDGITDATALGTVGSQVTSGTPTVIVGGLTLTATAPVAEIATISVPSSTYCIPPGAGVSVGTGPTSVTTNGTVPTANTGTVTVTSNGNSGTTTVGGVVYTWELPAAGGVGASGCGTTLNCILAYPTGSGNQGHYNAAEALYRAINNTGPSSCSNTPVGGVTQNPCYALISTQGANAEATASYSTGSGNGIVTIATWKCAGTASLYPISDTTGTGQDSVTQPTGGSDGSTSGSNFAIPSTASNTTLSGNINTAIANSGAAGFTKGYTSPTITLTASAAGSTGITDSLVGTPTGITVSVSTAGSNGSNTPPNFEYWSGNAAVSTNTLASNIAAAAVGNSDNVTLAYNSSTNTFTASGTGSNAGAQGNSVGVSGSLPGLTWKYNSNTTTTLQGGLGLIWTCQGTSNGQTTAAAPTGTSGLIIDNSGTFANGESNIYFGTLNGTGTSHAAVKMSQAGLK